MSNTLKTWMLPEGVIEALPDEAEKLNALTYTAMTIFSRWGYLPLRPPILEYADTFLMGERSDNLAEQTIQFKDQKSGKQLGLRADITPQIARIDGHYLKTDKVSRYTYAGEVVKSYPSADGSARNPTFVGAELLGSGSQQADIEIASLLITYLKQLQLPDITIELGHIDIITALLQSASIDDNQYTLFFETLAIKDKVKLAQLCQRHKVNAEYTALLQQITTLYGDSNVLSEALTLFEEYPSITREIKQLQAVTTILETLYPSIQFHIDLADVHGYGYYNGLIFSAYIRGVWQPIARGGRYDSYGNHFDEERKVRPSTGFSCNLTLLAPLLPTPKPTGRLICCSLKNMSAELLAFIDGLRAGGDTVVQQFDDDIAPNMAFTHVVNLGDSGFEVNPIKQ